MAKDNSIQVTNGIGFPGALTLVFVVAKLADKLDWSWWWVFSPLWISWLALVFAMTITEIAKDD
jgi:hypothetical protein